MTPTDHEDAPLTPELLGQLLDRNAALELFAQQWTAAADDCVHRSGIVLQWSTTTVARTVGEPAVSEEPSTDDASQDDGSRRSDASRPSDDSTTPPPDRRRFLAGMTGATVTGGLAAGGLAASYGRFAYMAADFLYPTGRGTAWMFVAPTDQIAPGGSFSFRSPTGLAVLITRKAESPRNVIPPTSDFLALSSVCPHLGCRVHWEPQNDRVFCPCNNGAFDPSGAPIAGPPKDGNQHLPKYPLKVDERGLLFIEMPAELIVQPERNIARKAGDASLVVKRSDSLDYSRENT